MNQFEVFPDNEQSSKFNRWINKKLPSLSNMALEMISDDNIKNSNHNKDRTIVYISHYPAGASLQSINHFIQNMESKKFSQYDYKLQANMRIYGSPHPIEYDLNKICGIPIALFGGKDDKLASEEDIEWLREKLDTNVVFYNIYEKMGHLSFLLSKDMEWFDDALTLINAFCGDIEIDNAKSNIDKQTIRRGNSITFIKSKDNEKIPNLETPANFDFEVNRESGEQMDSLNSGFLNLNQI